MCPEPQLIDIGCSQMPPRDAHQADCHKSTGGPAPRRALGDATGSPSEPQAPVAKTRKRRTFHDPDEVVTAVVSAGSGDPDANKWCAGCENSGFFFECELCKRWICDRCIAFDSDIDPEGHDFYCPKCWIEHPNKIPSWTGLFYGGKPTGTLKYTGVQTMRGRWPPLRAILRSSVGNHLTSYYKDPNKYLFDTITYDLVAGLDAHQAKKIIVFLTTQRHTEEGLIHTAKGGRAALDPRRRESYVLPRLLPLGLQQLIQAAPISLLVLQGCGALNMGWARAEVMDFVETQWASPPSSICRPPPNTFLQDVVHSLCITRGAKKFPQILHCHYKLGIHSDVIVYLPRPRCIYHFCWTQPMVRPYGHPVRPQCAKCQRLKPFRIDASRHTADQLVLVCKGCKHEEVYDHGNLAILGGVWDKKFKGVEGVCYIVHARNKRFSLLLPPPLGSDALLGPAWPRTWGVAITYVGGLFNSPHYLVLLDCPIPGQSLSLPTARLTRCSRVRAVHSTKNKLKRVVAIAAPRHFMARLLAALRTRITVQASPSFAPYGLFFGVSSPPAPAIKRVAPSTRRRERPTAQPPAWPRDRARLQHTVKLLNQELRDCFVPRRKLPARAPVTACDLTNGRPAPPPAPYPAIALRRARPQ
ncbi:hypothetical protein FB451DRAFT_1423833 [Mycena latifolia]|nr:hypothetical protein FB451DRAFT_1423833 [Mycena latifolia]